MRHRFIPACAGNTQADLRAASRMPGFIPACAGNTLEVMRRSAQQTVHPRVRGEHGAMPLLWVVTRFIPACAGNTIVVGPPLDPAI